MPESKKTSSQNLLPTLKSFSARHIGITDIESREMLEQLGYSSYKEFIEQVVPKDILNTQPLNLEEGISEEIATVFTNLLLDKVTTTPLHLKLF